MRLGDATSKERQKMAKYITAKTYAMQGDPGHLGNKKRDLLAAVRSDGCPTDWATFACSVFGALCIGYQWGF